MCVRRVCVAVVACAGALACGVVLFAAPPAPGGAAASVVNASRVTDGLLVASIERAVSGARRRLADDRCSAVLDQFADRDGRLLSSVATEFAGTPAESLSRIIFRDGRESATCRGTAVAAFTGRGSRVVFVCSAHFVRLGREAAELVVIHELLHTLGLGERPPTPDQIDKAVAQRCRA